MNFYDLLHYREREETRIARHGETSGRVSQHRAGGCCAASGRLRVLSSHLFHVTVFVFTLVTVMGRVRLSPHPLFSKGLVHGRRKDCGWQARCVPVPQLGLLSWTKVRAQLSRPRPPRPSPSRTLHLWGSVYRTPRVSSAGLQALGSACRHWLLPCL